VSEALAALSPRASSVRAAGPAVPRDWRPFVAAAIPASVLCLGLTVWLGFTIGGDTATTAVSDIGQAIPALVAGVSCAWAARRATRRTAWAWGLLAASATSWGIGEIVWSYYTVVASVSLPFPSAADVGFLAAVPFAIAGVLYFPSAPTRATTRIRALLDGATVALSLLFVSWALGLGEIYRQSADSVLARVIGLAYPITDIVILTVLFVVFRRSPSAQRGRLILLLAGLAANAFSDSTFAFITASGSFLSASYLFSTGWIYGYSLVALAPLWPEKPVSVRPDEGALSVWRLMLPWISVMAVVATVVGLQVTGRDMDGFLILPAAGLALVLMLSQAVAYKDSMVLLDASRRAELKLKDRSTVLNQVIDHAPQGVARIMVDGRLTNPNPALAAMLRAPLESLAGMPLEQVAPREDIERVFDAIGVSTERSTDTAQIDSRARRADGSEFWLQWSATAIRKLDGSVDYFLGMFEDITAKHEAEDNAAATLAQLERLNHLKSEFVSQVSHEFRTALVGIQGFSEMLKEGQLTQLDVQDMAADINSEAQRLNRMISSMLDLDRMEAGKIRLDLKPVSVNPLVNDVVDRTRVTTDNHTFTLSLDERDPVVAADADRLTQVLTNLLNNAVKYSPKGGDVSVTTVRRENDVEVTVRDHGIGIPPEFIQKLFGRYERFEDGRPGKIVGTGLGLAITRQIVEMHGGAITVESTVGSGSAFKFTIPLARVPAAS
jgi:two-component system, sensor histidine kinase and response regulator